jgi:hypothetical protein
MIRTQNSETGPVEVWFVEDQSQLNGWPSEWVSTDASPVREALNFNAPSGAVKAYVRGKMGLLGDVWEVRLNNKAILVIHGINLCGPGRLNPWCRSQH